MLDCGAVEPGPLPLIAGADAAIATELADRGRRLAGDVPTQGCTVHKHRNLLAHAPQRPHVS
jgi:hypothetical protein